MKKKLLPTILCASLLLPTVSSFSTPTEVHADPIYPLVYSIEVIELESEIKKLDNDIIELMVEIDKLDKTISDKSQKIEELKNEISIQEKRQEALMDIYLKRLQALQVKGTGDFNLFDVILSSESIPDFFNRIYTVSIILENDQKTMNELEKTKKYLEKSEKKLHKEIMDLKEAKLQLDSKKEELEKKKEQVTREVEEQKQLETLNQSIQTSTSIPSPTPAPNVSSEKAQEILNEAYQHIGTPYAWGGTTPNGFDCSGFTQYVFKKAGIKLPRTAKEQQSMGVSIPLSNLQPGDLVFMGNPAYHVGIYVGNGQYIHAPQTGDVVKVSKIYNITSAVRVM